jgi:small conductance mechanosensitive channel
LPKTQLLLPIPITPFVAAIGALSLGAGLAMQGLLSNYGAGIAIIISWPFRIGDTITVHQVAGEVKEIRLACTILLSEDGEEIMIPNKHVVGEIIHNSFANKLVETSIGISYQSSPDAAVAAIDAALRKLEFVSSSPEPQIGIDGFADSAMRIGVRYWVPTGRYHTCMYQANPAIHAAVLAAGIIIPYPQLDLHVQEGK